MEPHKELKNGTEIEKFRPLLEDGAKAFFQKAFSFTETYYKEELDHIWKTEFSEVTPEFFFREYVWVVHATGFSAKMVGRLLPRLLEAYGSYEVLAKTPLDDIVKRARIVLNNPPKITAVHKMAVMLKKGIEIYGWEKFKKENLSQPSLLAKTPYIGSITCFHLARNIGLLEFVKPDLHLVRLATHWGYKDCTEMCKEMATIHPTPIPLGIVDLVVWYLASTFGTIKARGIGFR